MQLARTYRIETERLIIRCYEPADAVKLHNAILISLDHLGKWMPWTKPEPLGLETRVERLRIFRGQFDLGQDYTFGIFDKKEKELIGSTGLHTRLESDTREIGYWINVKYINQGFATETVSALTKVGFELEQLSKIEIHCHPENKRSQNIPDKLGYNLKEKDSSSINENPMQFWIITKEEYEVSQIKTTRIKTYDIMERLVSSKTR